ncbi:MAG: SDR family oxidoreductase [Sphingomonadales bacterium]|nr:SDR family oxidoreductase [Sphingomonadales bacterium]
MEESPAPLSFSLAGRTVLVTGASAGIGAGFARLCARAGASVVAGARRVPAALAEEIGGLAVQLDVADEASVVAAYDAAEARFGTVDGIIANAGVGTGGHATAVPMSGLQGVLNTNLLGVYLTAREGAKRLIAAGSRDHQRGRVVLIGSTTALRTGMGDSLYAATKAGIEHLARNLAREWIRQGINVNCLHPGMIPSEANADWFKTERGRDNIAAQHRRRILAPDALDDMLLYLLSDRSAQVTGATFTIDDGQSL